MEYARQELRWRSIVQGQNTSNKHAGHLLAPIAKRHKQIRNSSGERCDVTCGPSLEIKKGPWLRGNQELFVYICYHLFIWGVYQSLSESIRVYQLFAVSWLLNHHPPNHSCYQDSICTRVEAQRETFYLCFLQKTRQHLRPEIHGNPR